MCQKGILSPADLPPSFRATIVPVKNIQFQVGALFHLCVLFKLLNVPYDKAVFQTQNVFNFHSKQFTVVNVYLWIMSHE